MESVIYKKKTGILFILYAAFLLIFAYGWHFGLPYYGTLDNYITMIQSNNWIMINLIGWIGILFGVFALFFLYGDMAANLKLTGNIGFIAVIVSFLIHLCLVSWEAFIWPVLAYDEQARLLIQNGVLIKSPQIIILYSLFSLTFLTGFILLGIALIKARFFSKPLVLLTITGSFLYSFAVAIGGYAGLIAFTVYLAGIMGLGIVIVKKSKSAVYAAEYGANPLVLNQLSNE